MIFLIDFIPFQTTTSVIFSQYRRDGTNKGGSQVRLKVVSHDNLANVALSYGPKLLAGLHILRQLDYPKHANQILERQVETIARTLKQD